MSARPTLALGDPRLRRRAEPVGAVTETVRMVWDDMIDTMEAMPGVGLAAPQIGIGLRLVVVDASARRGEAVRMADPVILHASGQRRRHAEASPHLPGVSAMIDRPRAVTVRFLNADGAVEDRDFVGLWATSVQHQIDHLDGTLFIDHLSPLRRTMILARIAKQARRGAG